MAAPPVVPPPPVEPALPPGTAPGNIYENYDAQGGANGQFAPAYIAGWGPSMEAVAKWTALNHPITRANIDETRMPNQWGSDANQRGPGGDVYGTSAVPHNVAFGDKRGTVDPEALRVMAQGGRYDMDARRNAIAQAMMQPAPQQQQKPNLDPTPYLIDHFRQWLNGEPGTGF